MHRRVAAERVAVAYQGSMRELSWLILTKQSNGKVYLLRSFINLLGKRGTTWRNVACFRVYPRRWSVICGEYFPSEWPFGTWTR